MTFVAIVSFLTFLGLFMFEEVTPKSVNGNILGIEDIVKYLGNQCDVSWTHYTLMYLNYLS
mgnify:CR=1 FL=1